MMDWMIRGSLRNRAAVLAVALILVAAGAWVAWAMPVDVFPDLTAPTVTVITEAHGMAPSEVESQVTFPIEAAVNGSSGVRRVRSSTGIGISVVWIEFDWGTDLPSARQVVSEKLALVSGSLPPGVERPVLAPVSSMLGEILFIALASDRHSGIELRTEADVVVRRRLLSVPGVSQVTPIGGGEKQLQAVLSPERMRAYRVGLEDVTRALGASNENVSAGFLNEGGTEHLVAGLGRLRGPEDVGATVVALRDGVPVLVRDLGEVRAGEAPKRGEASAQGRAAVVLGVQKQPGANTLALTRELDRVLDDLQARLPEGMKIDRALMRQADFIEVAVRNVEHALRDGGVLVVVIVMLFLANLRASLITLTAIPLSLLASVLALSALDASVNTMTLGGMAIAIGALVDDAIIDVENVFRRLRENAALPPERRRDALDVVYHASVEIRSSIVFATAIIVLVFVPLFFLPGVEGRLLRPLGVAYVVALAASLVVAVTVTPVLCLLFLPGSRAVRESHEPRFARWLKAGYARVLDPALRHPWLVAAPALALFAVAVSLPFTPLVGRAFLPEFNEGALTVNAVTLPGTALPESSRLGGLVEKIFLSHPEIVSVGRRTGRAELDEHAQGAESSELEVVYRLDRRTKAELLEALRDDCARVPGMAVTFGQPISHRIDHMLSGTRASIAIKIFGPDLYQLRAVGRRVEEAVKAVPGAVDVSLEQQADVPMLLARIDRPALARHGLKVEDAAHALEAGLQGLAVSRILEGQFAYDLVVRVADEGGWSTSSLADLPLDLPSGGKLPLKAVAAVVKDAGPNSISRENVERKIVVMANVAGRDVASVVEDCRRRIGPILAGEKGYRVEYGGQFEAAEAASKTLLVLGVGVVVAIGLLLHLAFGSVRDAAFVMANLPLALIGGMAGVLLSGGVLSIASIIGFITVFGIAARNGIMLVSHIRHLQIEEGVADLREAVRRASLERLAPILMTALAAGLALIPLALGGGKPGNEIQTPMAVVVLFGLLSSMVLNMVLVPALYVRFGKPAKGAA
jgi:CzcA family heavy metal efflux pump